MEQNLNNSQNDFLWTLLAHPADDGSMYAYNLQRLVNDFPQSGILQALLAHISDEKNLRRASVYFNPKSLFKLINSPSAFADVPENKIYSQTAVSSNGFYQHNRTLFNERLAERPEEITEINNEENTLVNDHLLTDTEPAIAPHPFEPESTVEHEQLTEPYVEDTIQHDHECHHPDAEFKEEITPVEEEHTENVAHDHELHHHSEFGEEITPVLEEHVEDVIQDHQIDHHSPESNDDVTPLTEEHVEDVAHDHQIDHHSPENSEEVRPVIEERVEDVARDHEIHHHSEFGEEITPVLEEQVEDVAHDHEIHHHSIENSEEVTPVTDEHIEDVAHDHEIHHRSIENSEEVIPVEEEHIEDIAHDIYRHPPENIEEVISTTDEHIEDVIHDHEIHHHSEFNEEAVPAAEEHFGNLHDNEIVHPADELDAADVKDKHSELPAYDWRTADTNPEEETPENRNEPIALIEDSAEYNHAVDLPQPVIGEHIHPAPQTWIEEDIDETFDEIVGIEDIDFSNPVSDRKEEGDNVFFAEQEEEYNAGEEEESEQPEVSISNTEDVAPDVNTHQDVSMYHDEKMPYTFMWWLDKTRKEHAAINQPYIKPPVTPQPEKKAKKGTDELQQQYYENIFHITSVEELDKNTPPPKAPYNTKRKEQVIIERFIKEEPQIKPQSSDKLDNENKAKKSSEDYDELVTETLAGIYSDQMLYHKAAASYKKLLLKYPEKSSYFAEKIEQLEKKIK